MMLKIDACDISKAIIDVRETRYPKKKYKEAGMFKSNMEMKAKTFERNNRLLTIPFEGDIKIRTNIKTFKFKKKFLCTYTKTEKATASEVVVALDKNFFKNNLTFFVADEDTGKFNMLMENINSDGTLDIAQFIRYNNIMVYDFIYGIAYR